MRADSLSILLLAPLTRDEIVEPAGARLRPGGAGLFAAAALAARGARVVLHTPLAEEDADLLAALPAAVEVVRHPSRATTRFRIETDPAAPNRRGLRCLAASDPLDPGRIGSLERYASILLGPTLPTDLPSEIWTRLAGAPCPIDLGAQGLVRTVAAGGAIEPSEACIGARCPSLRIVSGDAEEMERLGALDRIAEERVTTLGDRGARIRLRGGEVVEIVARPVRGPIRSTIGLGDTFLAVYGWERTGGAPPREAGARAAEAASRLIEAGGPPSSSEEDPGGR